MAQETKPKAMPPLPPWPIMAAAGVMLLLAFALSWLPDVLVLVRVLLIVGGLSLAGGAIWLQPREARLILAGAALSLFATWCLDPWWDSAIMLLFVLTCVGLVAAFLVGLPWLTGWLYIAKNHVSNRPGDPDDAFAQGQGAGQVAAKVLVSLLILLHFGGVATAILATAAGGSEPAWLARKSWTFYDNYLNFIYLTNAYKFYSPEPGPAFMLFARIEYDDSSVHEIFLPNRPEHAPDPLAQEFTRRLSIANGISNFSDDGPTPRAMERRMGRGILSIPLHPYIQSMSQFQRPNEYSLRLLKEYVRHMASRYPHKTNPAIGIAGIKIYRVTHLMLTPNQMRDPNQSPEAKWTYLPYFMGEYSADGVLKDPYDPLLYWLIPIYRGPRDGRIDLLSNQVNIVEPEFGDDFIVHNFFELHKNQSMGRKAP